MKKRRLFQLVYKACLSIWIGVVGVMGCQTTPDVVPIVNTSTALPTQAALVSVQPMGSGTAEVVIKLTAAIKPTDWRLTVQNTTIGAATPTLEPGATQLLDRFSLTTFRLTGVSVGQTYRLRLGFRYNQRDTLTLERNYTHTAYNPWKRLAHLSFNDGLFTGSVYDRSDDRSGSVVRVTRYVNDSEWQSNAYSYRTNEWFPDSPPGLPPRRGLIEYDVYFSGTDRHYFYGLGYQTDDLFPGRYVYMREMYVILPGSASLVLPFYQGDAGEIAYFTTTEWAFFLTNNGPPAMRGIYAQFEQESRAPLPEPPGILTTFSLGETGYVVNQVPGRQPRLFAYDSQKNVWTRRADFPGTQRSRGVSFALRGKGYFGLGTAANQQGLRDLWQYDPATDQWRYSTDYPGQGNRYLVTYSARERVYIGFGYENQTVLGSPGVRQAGCTDFWEFRP